jgi:hypothetical protein
MFYNNKTRTKHIRKCPAPKASQVKSLHILKVKSDNPNLDNVMFALNEQGMDVM